MADKMICNICGQEVNIRKISGFGNPLPVRHPSPDTPNNCHGFYVSGHRVKEEDNG